jgi:hypothetical protein
MIAETVLKGGTFPTAPGAESLAIANGRIVALGRGEGVERLVAESTVTIDLAGRAVLPGFIDAHTHLLPGTGLQEIGWEIDLSGLGRAETLARLAEAARARGEGEWVVGRGWDESTWKERHYLERVELDAAAPRNPLVAVRVDGHLLTANTHALKRIPARVDQSEVDPSRGHLREEAALSLLRTSEPDEETLVQALRATAALAHRLGVTSVHTMVRPDQIALFLREHGRIDLRVTLCPEVPCLEALEILKVRSGFGDEWLRLGGLKVFADGSIGAGNAAVGRPYEDTGENGTLHYSDAELALVLERAEEAGLQTVVHAIGDRAINQVLQAHETVGSSEALRHRIEHFELPSRGHLERARRLGLQISMQPNFVGTWSGKGKLYETRLGEDRDRQSDPHRLVLDSGLRLAFGSDCMPLSPLYGLHWAVNAPHPGQRVTVEEGIACYTEGGAYLAFEEKEKGRIDVGWLADLVVLDQDPRRVPERIADLTVEMTFVGGKLVYFRKEESCA